ncbi:MAG: hypothetical protein FJW86_03720 [Actinobacteria bacterium]|nr:hypothetical protein [Actinomycetota bacterium]
MARELTPRELDELLGAYALDAIDGDERDQIEAWLARTPDAREELAALRETAALLTQPLTEAPPGVWARIEEALTVAPPPLQLSNHRRRIAVRMMAALVAASAAAATITAVVLSNEMSEQEDRLATVTRSVRKDGMSRAAMAALADPTARTLFLESSVDAARATLVTMPDGEGFLTEVHLPRLESGQTYQLWAITGTGAEKVMVSAGVLGRDVDVAGFRAPRDAEGFAITAEPTSGSKAPHGQPVVEGTFSG